MFLTCTQKAIVLPFSMEQLRLHCRIDEDDDRDDAILNLYAWAAIQQGEFITNRVWLKSEWSGTLKKFPDEYFHYGWCVIGRKHITINCTPCTSVSDITYLDVAGIEEDFTEYLFEPSSLEWDGGRPFAKITLPTGVNEWPTGTDVTINFTAGWPIVEFPEILQQWIFVKVSSHYEQREDLASATRKMAIGFPRDFVDSLLDPYYLPK